MEINRHYCLDQLVLILNAISQTLNVVKRAELVSFHILSSLKQLLGLKMFPDKKDNRELLVAAQ